MPVVSPSSSTSLHRYGLVLFFCSGLSSLVYEVLWSRRLGLTFGHSTLAVSTVVTAYMVGLAAGSWLGGRWADRRLQGGPGFLKSYALLELFIGLWGALSLVLLGWVETVYLGAASQGWAGSSLELLAFGLCLLVLLPPTTAMGATLPILCCFYSEAGNREVGVKLSQLYASNTWGAVVGACLAGFVWLPYGGLQNSVLGAAAINVVIALAGLWLSRGCGTPLLHLAPRSTEPSAYPWVFALSGFASMLLQLGWTRGFSVLMGSSVYAFASILLAFLGGIALGSSIYGRLLRGRTPSRLALSCLYAGTGAGGLISLAILIRLPDWFTSLYPYLKDSFVALLGLTVALSSLVMLLPTVLMGLIFPLVTHLHYERRSGLGGSVGAIYAANSAGCILGSFLGGFWLLPQLGLQTTVVLGAFLYGLCALAVDRRLLPVLLVFAWWGWALPPWDTGFASAGKAISVARDQGGGEDDYVKPVFYRDGLSCTVALAVEGPDALSLRINGKADASLQLPDRLTQLSLGFIPLLYQPHPKRAAVIGLGSGLTLTALSSLPGLELVECAELEPAVVECQPFWAPYNRNVIRDPRVHLKVADGRTFLMSSSGGYDILVSEPSNPWIAGIGNLYTLDFYQQCALKLNSTGCFMQWCNLYAISPADVDLVLRTFYRAFPYGELWTSGGDLLLVGALEPTQANPKRLEEARPWLWSDLKELGFENAEELAGQYLCSRDEALARVADGPLNRDDLPLLEYSAPRSLYRSDALAVNLKRCLQWRQEKLPSGWPDNAQTRLNAWIGRLNFSFPQFLRFPLEQVPAPWKAYFAHRGRMPTLQEAQKLPYRARQELARKALREGRPAEVLDLCDEEILQAAAFYQLGRWQEAASLYERLVGQESTGSSWAALATCRFFLHQASEADQAARQALRLNPYEPRALYVQAALQNSLEGAQQLTRVCPGMANGWVLLARLLAAAQRTQEARQAVVRGLRVAPGHPGLQRQGQELGLQIP